MPLLETFARIRNQWLGQLIGPLLDVSGPPGGPPRGVEGRTLVYVLDGRSLINEVIFQRQCRRLGLPAPGREATLVHRGARRWWRRLPESGEALVLPVAVYIGRTPSKQRSLLRLVFSESWAVSRSLGKLLALLLNGRDTLVVLGEPETPEADRQALAERLEHQLDGLRTATIGPDFSHRRTLVRTLLGRFNIRRAVVADARVRGRKPMRSLRRAERILVAMVADCTQITLRVLHQLLGWFWNRFYDGIEARNIERVRRIAARSRVVYVPSHRSHIDYLVLSYLLYEHNLAIPYIAAGDNLDIPVIGRILRGGGAFFIRRSFKGDALYAALVSEYVHETLRRGAPVEYFIEGGRSRTGRQLTARTGMLAMTLSSFLRDHRRPLAFVPVSFSYEKLIEAPTYLNELRGKGKRKESVGGLLRALAGLRGRFGRVVASFGEPIDLAGFLDTRQPGWRQAPREAMARPPWSAAVLADLGRALGQAINAQSYLNPVHLVALSLLPMPRQIADLGTLVGQIEVLRRLPPRLPGGRSVGVTGLDAMAVVRQVESLGLVGRRHDSLGDLLYADGNLSVLLTYYRNNALHLYVLPALIASAFQQSRSLRLSQLHRIVEQVYPVLMDELTIAPAAPTLAEATDQAVRAMVETGLLEQTLDRVQRPPARDPNARRLNLLAGLVQNSLERYFLVIAVLLGQRGQVIARDALIDRCRALAERMSVLYGVDAPEFFDRSLFERFVEELTRRRLIREDADGGLVLDPASLGMEGDARLLLSDRIRHGVLNLLGTEAVGS